MLHATFTRTALLALAIAWATGGCMDVDEQDESDTSPDGDAGADGSVPDDDPDGSTDTDDVEDAGPPGDASVFEMDCSACPSVGDGAEEMLCALDLCDSEYVVQNEIVAVSDLSSGSCEITDMYHAVSWFGITLNDLGPKKNDSYSLLASGPAEGTAHSVGCTSGPGIDDPYAPEETAQAYDAIEWRLALVAPETVAGFRFKYVFFSEEYDDFIGTSVNDKFYVLLEAGSTNDGAPTIINFTDCRAPDEYYDFICGPDDPACDDGERYCYIAINSAFSDCCWYDACPDGYSADVGADITGTGFECAMGMSDDSSSKGSSTGWLQTAWPIEGGEMFSLTFHIHDTGDAIFDSEVILDSFEFLLDSAFSIGTSEVPEIE